MTGDHGEGAAGTSAHEDARRFIVAADRLIDGSGAEPLVDGAVLVEDGRITAVDRRSAFGTSDIAIIAEAGTTLLPGIVDSHVHLELAAGPDHATTLATWDEDRAAGRLGLRALANARTALSAGITTLRDCGATLGILAVREALRTAEVPGPRLLATGPPLTTRRGHCHWFGGEAETDAELRARIAANCEAGVDAIKVIATGGVMTEGSDPRLAQYDERQMRLIVAEAHRLGRPVVAHANATVGIANAFAAGADAIDHVMFTAPDGKVRPDESLIARMGAAGQACGMTLGGIHRQNLDAGDEGVARLRERFGHKAALHEAGALLHLQSDAGVRLTPPDRPDGAMRTAIVGTGLSPLAILTAMTGSAARAVGLGGEVGVLRPGAHADLLLVAGDPIAESAALGDVRGVWAGGRRVVRVDGKAAAPLAGGMSTAT